MDLDPQGRVVRSLVWPRWDLHSFGPLTPHCSRGCLHLNLINCKSLWIKVSAKWRVMQCSVMLSPTLSPLSTQRCFTFMNRGFAFSLVNDYMCGFSLKDPKVQYGNLARAPPTAPQSHCIITSHPAIFFLAGSITQSDLQCKGTSVHPWESGRGTGRIRERERERERESVRGTGRIREREGKRARVRKRYR